MPTLMLLALVVAAPPGAPEPAGDPHRLDGVEMRGVCYAHAWRGGGRLGYGSAASARSLGELKEIGVGWVSLTPFGYQRTLHEDRVRMGPNYPGGETDARLATEVKRARALGMKVLLKPHIWIHGGEWCGHIDAGSPERWRTWMETYEAFILHYARLAERLGMDALAVGTELVGPVRANAEAWRRLIARVRAVYHGPLTYAANWNATHLIPFWDLLDFIGVQAYEPLIGTPGAPESALAKGARKMAIGLGALAHKHRRPIVLTEVGYRSAKGSAAAPNQWPEDAKGAIRDDAHQAAAYKAVLDALEGRPWYRGIFWWKWFSDPAAVEEGPLGFTPKAPARELLRQRWAR